MRTKLYSTHEAEGDNGKIRNKVGDEGNCGSNTSAAFLNARHKTAKTNSER